MFLDGELKKKKIVLMGLGLYEKGSGLSAAKFFIGKCRELVITDLKSARELRRQVNAILRAPTQKSGRSNPVATKITWHLGGHRREDFKTADLIFQNPSVPANSPFLKIARQRKIPIVNDWSIFLSVHDPKVFVGVTGTRGKSTTTALICEMIKKKYKKVWLAGNLGVSPLNFVVNSSSRGRAKRNRGDLVNQRDCFAIARNDMVLVAELSSWLLHHFSRAQTSPNIAVVTNIMKDHLDKYRSMKEYIADKENIFRFQKGGDAVVLNWDNQYTREMGNEIKRISERQFAPKSARTYVRYSKPVWFSLKKHWPNWVPFQKIKLLGQHNLANVLAAAAAAEAAGVSRRDIVSVLKNFRGLPNRLELVRTVGGVKYYNDTTATTPDATIAALKTLNPIPHTLYPKIILIAGGADKKLDYKELAKYIKRYCKAMVFLPGAATEKIKKYVTCYMLHVTCVKSMAEAIKTARRIAERGDIVLLSPAAASFGLFKNEFERGKQFVKEVSKIRIKD